MTDLGVALFVIAGETQAFAVMDKPTMQRVFWRHGGPEHSLYYHKAKYILPIA
jgi:hypothetical protein